MIMIITSEDGERVLLGIINPKRIEELQNLSNASSLNIPIIEKHMETQDIDYEEVESITNISILDTSE